MVYGSPDEGSLGYVPPRQVSFNWIGESVNLFGARAGIWVVATLICAGLPYLLLGLADFLLGDPFQFGMAFRINRPGYAARPISPSSGQSVVFWGAYLVFYVVLLFFCAGLYRMAVRQVRGLPLRFADIFGGGRVFGRTVGFTLLFAFAYLGLEVIGFAPFLIALLSAGHAGVLAALAVPSPSGSAALMTSIVASIGLVVLGGAVVLLGGLVLIGLLSPGFALVADGEGVFVAIRRSIQAMRAQWLAAAGLVFVIGILVFLSELPCGLGLLVTLPMCFLISALAYRDMIGMPGRLFPPPPSYGVEQPGVWPPPPGLVPPPTWGPTPPPSPPDAPPPRTP